ncbi:MAG: hypothetical protein EXX96DRAFT_553581 [Benjaminiella poitrasii]|nr:MAG: hypothetical protein EXX96DRAFT_553581 [Benjaminiella poitrasii]
MNLFTLPKSMRPGSDLISKIAIKDPMVINIITKALLNVENDYHVGNSEWDNGMRSDVVLQPKSSASNLPPTIIEIQQTIDALFIKRVINYSLQAFKR